MVMHKEQERYLQKEVLGTRILNQARNELYLHMRFLDLALGSFPVRPGAEVHPAGTDGGTLFFAPDDLLKLYQTGRVYVMRLYLHGLMHCLFCHPFYRKERDMEYWNLACDIAAESVLDGLHLKCVHLPGVFRQAVYARLKEKLTVLTAGGIYRELCRMQISGSELMGWKQAFSVDDHSLWEQEKPPSQVEQNRKQWENLRERMEMDMETFSKEAAEGSKGLVEQLRIENHRRYDYREFLRRFSVRKEEMQVDMDTFDYVFYHYGLSLYGNMPLIEPQETKEVQKIEEFVIVIDTSMSCKDELVRRFLEETYNVLQESESFFREIHIRILQCDDRVQSDAEITGQEELKSYMEHLTIKGQGGTDFRPAFAYVEELLTRKAFYRLRGLLYFTDGYGTFPAKMPPYETAFIFIKDNYRDVDVPPWAIKLILGPDELSE
ncbi:VWA-like domain-containing protein [Candidatus Merdisoma sp. JLR.KK006]|uniref:vWA domain-containing protein n=1 Tax=Candidatus Merdisoma sp. JLR.KK006 TaxID=3112626 RepID=UPI002FEEC032